jgi:hypothetical protein
LLSQARARKSRPSEIAQANSDRPAHTYPVIFRTLLYFLIIIFFSGQGQFVQRRDTQNDDEGYDKNADYSYQNVGKRADKCGKIHVISLLAVETEY